MLQLVTRSPVVAANNGAVSECNCAIQVLRVASRSARRAKAPWSFQRKSAFSKRRKGVRTNFASSEKAAEGVAWPYLACRVTWTWFVTIRIDRTDPTFLQIKVDVIPAESQTSAFIKLWIKSLKSQAVPKTVLSSKHFQLRKDTI